MGNLCVRGIGVSDALPRWRQLLRSARQREGRAPQARWLQLATLGLDGTPRVRTLVFRGWSGPAQLDLLTDGRSSKAAELLRHPWVEICWLLPKAQSQFRLRGTRIQLGPDDDQAAREQRWHQLNPGARALWGWPEPGAPFEAGASVPAELIDGTPIPPCFELVKITIAQVELLELKGHPHQRRRWRADQNWEEERLNP